MQGVNHNEGEPTATTRVFLVDPAVLQDVAGNHAEQAVLELVLNDKEKPSIAVRRVHDRVPRRAGLTGVAPVTRSCPSGHTIVYLRSLVRSPPMLSLAVDSNISKSVSVQPGSPAWTLVFVSWNHIEWFRQARRGNTGWQAIK